MMEKTKIKEYKELFDNLKNGNQYYRLGKKTGYSVAGYAKNRR